MTVMQQWTSRDVPDQSGTVAIITGASSGIGASAAIALAGRAAAVVLAVRNPAKADTVRTAILSRHPSAEVLIQTLDLADLASIRAFADRILSAHPQIDILLNNAGLGLLPKRDLTADGFETQFGTNHLGHFALTGLLLPALLAAPAACVVTVSSLIHRRGRIDFQDLQAERGYRPARAYAQSKLANLMFALALQRRAAGAGVALASLAAHPGISATNFFSNSAFKAFAIGPDNPIVRRLGFDAANGALPGLYAATMPDASGGEYWGPDGLLEMRGSPARSRIARQATDRSAQDRLWEMSEQLTGIVYPPFR